MAVRSKTLGRVGFVLTLLCLTALLISFASDRWIVSSGKDNVGFENLGLWSVCFKEYFPPATAIVNRQYDGCWWVLNKELDDLRDFLIPSWYESTQILVTLALVLVLIDCIIQVVNLINCFPYSPHRHFIKRILAIVGSVLLILSAILLFIAILAFGLESSNTGNGWLQNNDENYLSWSFGMCILADFLAILASMVILMQFFRHRAEKDDSSTFEPQVIMTNKPPPATNYKYSQNSNRGGGDRSLAMTDGGNSRDPAYVQRYNQQNRDESKASLISGPTEMFAVSGRGEVYVNNMATDDNNYRQRPPPSRYDEYRNGMPAQRNNVQPVSSSTQRNNSQPVTQSNRGRQLGRQGIPLRLQEPSFKNARTDGGGSQNGSSYDDGDFKSSRHTSIPEYVPKQKNEVTATEEDSYAENDSDNASTQNTKNRKKKREKSNDASGGEKREGRKKSRSVSKSGDKDSRERSRSRSNSRSRKKTKNDSDTDGGTPSQRRRSKKKHRSSSVKGESSDDEQRSQSGRRSGRRNNSRTRSRSRSKDRFASDSQLDSDTGSTHSRSRRKKRKEKELSRMDAKRRSASEDNLSVRSGGKRRSGRVKKKYDGNVSDDFSGSEYSQRRSRRKGGRQSEGETRSRQRDYSDNESVKSRSKKPKGTYSSYYEY